MGPSAVLGSFENVALTGVRITALPLLSGSLNRLWCTGRPSIKREFVSF